jgi:hypothetical protein
VTFDQLIIQQWPHVLRVIQDIARRNYLAATEIEDFKHAVERALERNGHELLKAFDGRSTWETYLTTVVTRQFFLFQAALWGPWRPTSAALRLGPAAMLLEELVIRDGFGISSAIDWMRTTHRVDLSRHRLLQLAEQLALADTSAATQHAKAPVRSAAAQATIDVALRDALALVTPDERLILELRFRDRQPLTRIAAVLKTDARPLQRRIETALAVIRESLITQGIDADEVERLLRSAEGDSSGTQRWWDFVLVRPSKETSDR